MMKQMKFLTLALALLVGMMMTSCLNSDSDPTRRSYMMGRLQTSGLYGTTIVSADGQRLVPTAESIMQFNMNNNISLDSYNGQVVVAYFSWNSDLVNVDLTATEISGVSLYSLELVERPTLVCYAANKGVEGRDSVATDAIISLNPSTGSGKYQPYFFDDSRNILVLPVNYYLPTTNQGISHTLVYYPDDADTQADKEQGILRLYLNYRTPANLTPTLNNPSMDLANYYGLSLFFKSYDLSDYSRGQSILNAWGSATAPEHINIVVSENENSWQLSTSEQKAYPVVTWREYQTGLGIY